MKGSTTTTMITAAATMVVLLFTSLCSGSDTDADLPPPSARRRAKGRTTANTHRSSIPSAAQDLFVQPKNATNRLHSRSLQDEEFRNNDFTSDPHAFSQVYRHVEALPAVLDFDLGLGTPAVEDEPTPEMAERDQNEQCPSNKWCDDGGIDNSMWMKYRGSTMSSGVTRCMRFLVCGKNPDRKIQMAIYKRNSASQGDSYELLAADANDLYFEILDLDPTEDLSILIDGVDGASEYGQMVIVSCVDDEAADPYNHCPNEPFVRPSNERHDFPKPIRIDDETLPFHIPYSNLYSRFYGDGTLKFIARLSGYNLFIEDESQRTRPCKPGKWCDSQWDGGLWFKLNFASPSQCVQVVTCDDQDMQLVAFSGAIINADDDGGRLANTPKLEFKPRGGDENLNLLGLDGFEGTRSEGFLVFAACDDQDPYLHCPAAPAPACTDRGPAEAALELAIKAGQHEKPGRLTANSPALNKCDDGGDGAESQPGLVYSVTGNGKPITVTTCDLGVKPSFRIDLSVMQCNAESGKDACVAVSKQGRCGHGMHVTFHTVKRERYEVLVRGANGGGGTGKFAIQAFQLAGPSLANIKKCASALEKFCPNIGCPNWTRCEIKKIAAFCTHSKTCRDKCKSWWACTREESRGVVGTACEGLSPALSVRKEEGKAARNMLLEKINNKCGSNMPTLT